MAFCSNCGHQVDDKAVVCVKCGVAVNNAKIDQLSNNNNEQKEWVVTLLLCFFLGYLGVHRFYTGHTGIGIAQLLTLGGCGIWTLIDFILILVGSFKDAQGRPLKK
ncbi:MAG: TM2 domain-containing protein [Candidatus Symbiobacter sp.]|nr:TM2 domain-containing protein [Candidatus Symbiobacter sp.]